MENQVTFANNNNNIKRTVKTVKNTTPREPEHDFNTIKNLSIFVFIIAGFTNASLGHVILMSHIILKLKISMSTQSLNWAAKWSMIILKLWTALF